MSRPQGSIKARVRQEGVPKVMFSGSRFALALQPDETPLLPSLQLPRRYTDHWIVAVVTMAVGTRPDATVPMRVKAPEPALMLYADTLSEPRFAT